MTDGVRLGRNGQNRESAAEISIYGDRLIDSFGKLSLRDSIRRTSAGIPPKAGTMTSCR
jgi:hypothetical protein